MAGLPVFYATTEGHTRRIAQAIASTLRDEVRSDYPCRGADRAAYSLYITAAIVGGSIHGGRDQRAMWRRSLP